ncbi:MAG: hypothetical protein GQE15_02460 [Archangiaceae bacterium]|nr:hypothetical protein [Archangiaceae bacterium]
MPRWETKSAKGEKFLELVLDDDRLWTAEGSRQPGQQEWSVNHSDPKMFRFNAGAAAAKADYDKRVGKLPKSAVLVGDETPVITPKRDQALRDRAELFESMRLWEAEHGLIAKLKATGAARLVGLKAHNKEEYVEVALDGTTVLKRRGKGSGKPKTEKEQEPTLERALITAQLFLMSNMAMGSFGPAPR